MVKKQNHNRGKSYKKGLISVIIVALLAATGSVALNFDDFPLLEAFFGPKVENINVDGTLADSGEIPEYNGDTYITVNDNEPSFTDDIIAKAEGGSFETYSRQDIRGRCNTAVACLSTDTMPDANEERGNISSIHPSGWQYGYEWERCHLIGWQLSAENDNKRNLITGTHYLNVSGMLPFENEVANYIKDTNRHVLYEVTPVYSGDDLIASGVQIQAMSIEDNGRGVSFNVYCFNVSPGYIIDYNSGEVYPERT